jgi:hypothetical protein
MDNPDPKRRFAALRARYYGTALLGAALLVYWGARALLARRGG